MLAFALPTCVHVLMKIDFVRNSNSFSSTQVYRLPNKRLNFNYSVALSYYHMNDTHRMKMKSLC